MRVASPPRDQDSHLADAAVGNAGISATVTKFVKKKITDKEKLDLFSSMAAMVSILPPQRPCVLQRSSSSNASRVWPGTQ